MASDITQPSDLGITPPSGGFQQGGWYWDQKANNARQFVNGTFGNPATIHPQSSQPGAGQPVAKQWQPTISSPSTGNNTDTQSDKTTSNSWNGDINNTPGLTPDNNSVIKPTNNTTTNTPTSPMNTQTANPSAQPQTTGEAAQKALAAGADPQTIATARKYLGDQDFIGYCQAFVEKASGSGWQGTSAIDAWNRQIAKQQTNFSNLKSGDELYFAPDASNGGYGHTGIYCVDEKTEILTYRGWLKYNEVKKGDLVAAYSLEKNILTWDISKSINIFDYEGLMIRAGRKQSFSMLVTPDHSVVWTTKHDKTARLRRITKASEMFSRKGKTNNRRKIPVAASWDNYGVEGSYKDGLRIGWFLSEGWWGHKNRKTPDLGLSQSLKANPQKCKELEKLFGDTELYTITKHKQCLSLYIKPLGRILFEKWAKEKKPNWEMLLKFSKETLEGCYRGMLEGDGDSTRNYTNARLFQKAGPIADFFQALSIRLGKRANIRKNNIHPNMVTIYVHNKWLWADAGIPTVEYYKGKVWCPTLQTGFWMARREGSPFITGNSGNGNFISATNNGVQQSNIADWVKSTGQKILGFIANPNSPGGINSGNNLISNIMGGVGNAEKTVQNTANNIGSWAGNEANKIRNTIVPQAQASGFPPQAFADNTLPSYVPTWVQDTLVKAAQSNDVPPSVLASVIETENGKWDPRAIQQGGMGRGLAQIDLGQNNVTEAEALDPKFALNWAAKYLKEGFDKTGTWNGAVRYYNGGPSFDSNQVGYGGNTVNSNTNTYLGKVVNNMTNLKPYVQEQASKMTKDLMDKKSQAKSDLDYKFPLMQNLMHVLDNVNLTTPA